MGDQNFIKDFFFYTLHNYLYVHTYVSTVI